MCFLRRSEGEDVKVTYRRRTADIEADIPRKRTIMPMNRTCPAIVA
jgi:hypothetical protein